MSLVCCFAEADTTEVKVTHVTLLATALAAASDDARLKLGRPLRTRNDCFSCHCENGVVSCCGRLVPKCTTAPP